MQPKGCALPRELHKKYADMFGYFWAPCPWPECGRMFGGHEKMGTGLPTTEPGIYKMSCSLHVNKPLPPPEVWPRPEWYPVWFGQCA